MGRIIGGVVGGFVISQIIIGIVMMVLAFVLGKDGLLTADKAPTTTWMVVFVVCAAIGGYIAGAAARWIARDKKVVKAYILTSIFFTIVFTCWAQFGPKPPKPEQPKTPIPEWAQTMQAFGEAQQGLPIWVMLGATVLSLGGVYLGGSSGKDASPSEKPVA